MINFWDSDDITTFNTCTTTLTTAEILQRQREKVNAQHLQRAHRYDRHQQLPDDVSPPPISVVPQPVSLARQRATLAGEEHRKHYTIIYTDTQNLMDAISVIPLNKGGVFRVTNTYKDCVREPVILFSETCVRRAVHKLLSKRSVGATSIKVEVVMCNEPKREHLKQMRLAGSKPWASRVSSRVVCFSGNNTVSK